MKRGVTKSTLGLAVAGIALSGCMSTVNTGIQVKNSKSIAVTDTVTLTGQVAKVVSSNPSELLDLKTIIINNGGTVQNMKVSSNNVTITSSLPANNLSKASLLDGVDGVALSRINNGVKTTVYVTTPTSLISAIKSSVAHQPNPKATAYTMLSLTNISITVSYAGGVITAPTGAHVPSGSNSATWTSSLANIQPTTLVFTGSTQSPLYVYGGIAVASGVVVFLYLRYRTLRKG